MYFKGQDFADEYHAWTLTSFQATSLKLANGKLLVATGDGTHETKGGLYIIDAKNRETLKFIEADNARSVDVDVAGNIYLMQAQHARITKYDADGNLLATVYNVPREAQQVGAKSEMLLWKGNKQYIFTALNESGLRMLDANMENGIIDYLDSPGEDIELDVTNSVSINTDLKKKSQGEDIQSNLLLLANGGKGVYWYDVNAFTTDDQENDRIILCNNNSILEGGSINYIASKGNIAFVADGSGGLKILYIDFYQ
jgi:hypothetical protein